MPLIAAGAIAYSLDQNADWSVPASLVALAETRSEPATAKAELVSALQEQPKAAVYVALTTPLSSLLKNADVQPALLNELEIAVVSNLESYQPWELCTVLWCFAMYGHQPNREFMQRTYKFIHANWSNMQLSDLVFTLWSLSNITDVHEDFWSIIMRLIGQHGVASYDEPTSVYLLHALVLEASKRSGWVAATPRATVEEVEKLTGSLPRAVRKKITQLYRQYVPFPPYIDEAYFIITYVVSTLPKLQTAASPISTSWYSIGLQTSDIQKTKQILNDLKTLDNLKRDLAFHWRDDELLNAKQKVVNELAYVITRRLDTPIEVPADVDILISKKRIAFFVEDDVSKHVQEEYNIDLAHSAVSSLIMDSYTPSKCYTSNNCHGVALAKKARMRARGFKVITVKTSDWMKLKLLPEKEAFVSQLLAK